MKKPTHSTLIALVTVISLLPVFIFLASIRISDYKENQIRIAKSATAGVSEMIRQSISEKQRTVELFSEEYKSQILEAVSDPDNLVLFEKLENKIKSFFPDYFSYTLADTTGELIFDDFDGYIGSMCIDDLKTYVATKKHKTRIHPNPYAYHIDVIAEWQHKGVKGLLFISFKPDILGQILKASEPESQILMLVIKDQQNLIEVTKAGHRLHLTDRNDFRMSNSEIQQILYQEKIPGTYWHILGLQDEEHYLTAKRNIYLQMGSVYMIFLVVVLILWYVLHRYELQRIVLSDKLILKNQILEEENKLAVNVHERITTKLNEPIENLQAHVSSMMTFSGDVQFCHGKNTDNYYLLLGDFTGHGLGAALGAIPLADIFFTMAGEGCSIEEIAASCNKKLYDVLPIERFCCALILCWHKPDNTLDICNAGLPDANIIDANGKIKEDIGSGMLPLGIIPELEVNSVTIKLSESDYLLGYTDGLIEALDENGSMFGTDRIMDCIHHSTSKNLFNNLIDELADFTGKNSQQDDISMFILSFRKGE
ncbi:MAG TPA: serine/threonine-protein phosphatase [Gammaproteobacteria bacterium]|nr:serine/threonine-protein phosphatase [Gammaproteobacteria bacterium]